MQYRHYYLIIAIIFMFLRMIASWKTDTTCRCGQASSGSFGWRIVGGRTAVPHSHPWLVALYYYDSLDCGGSLITNRHVLGAGHCIKGRKKDAISVRIGMHQTDDKDIIVRKVDDLIMHPSFVSMHFMDDNDIAIYKLDEVVQFTATILPICLPYEGINYEDATAVVAGWGYITQNGTETNILKEVEVEVLKEERCQEMGLSMYLTSNMICAYSPTGDGCQGDSGGPLAINNNGSITQIGVVSWGIGCAHPKYPGAYAKLTNYLEWIKEVTEESTSCSI